MAHNRLVQFGVNVHAPGVLAALDEFVQTLAMRHCERLPNGTWKTGPQCAREIRITWAEIRRNLELDLTT